ncbi:MAG: hypothetical protein FWD15_03035 [Alphaproteobacteria bacterium]|nr:hypothetical protein [Alphaproteobacteria bacterium]
MVITLNEGKQSVLIAELGAIIDNDYVLGNIKVDGEAGIHTADLYTTNCRPASTGKRDGANLAERVFAWKNKNPINDKPSYSSYIHDVNFEDVLSKAIFTMLFHKLQRQEENRKLLDVDLDTHKLAYESTFGKEDSLMQKEIWPRIHEIMGGKPK